jgi:hypothetical protein
MPMKQRFLNQKLGKRISRKANLQKAKLFAGKVERHPRPGLPGRNFPAGKPA